MFRIRTEKYIRICTKLTVKKFPNLIASKWVFITWKNWLDAYYYILTKS